MRELCGLAHHRLSRRSLMAGAGAALAASAFPSARLLAAEPPTEDAPNAISSRRGAATPHGRQRALRRQYAE